MKRNYPFIDLVYGTHNLYRLPEYLHRVLRDRAPVVEVVETRRRRSSRVCPRRARAASAPS